MDVTWVHGGPGEEALQVHRAADGTFVLRLTARMRDVLMPLLFRRFALNGSA